MDDSFKSLRVEENKRVVHETRSVVNFQTDFEFSMPQKPPQTFTRDEIIELCHGRCSCSRNSISLRSAVAKWASARRELSVSSAFNRLRVVSKTLRRTHHRERVAQCLHQWKWGRGSEGFYRWKQHTRGINACQRNLETFDWSLQLWLRQCKRPFVSIQKSR